MKSATKTQQLITSHRGGFRPGYNRILSEKDGSLEAGMDFGIHVFRAGERLEQALHKECVWVLLHGRATVAWGDEEHVVRRDTLFDEGPTALHVGPNTRIRLRAESDLVEWAFIAVTNENEFAPRLFLPHDVEPEYRGLGLAQGTCLRNVRQIFDRGLRPESNLVLGEVINYPGRWSSYPPHHHAQPEIYHYRFNQPKGYGHGEVGDDVFKVQQFDTLLIPGMHDHAQVAAPGYAMYYLWIVRHLADNPYEGFEFTPDHEWVLDAKSGVWEPQDVPYTSREADGSDVRRPWTRSPSSPSSTTPTSTSSKGAKGGEGTPTTRKRTTRKSTRKTTGKSTSKRSGSTRKKATGTTAARSPRKRAGGNAGSSRSSVKRNGSKRNGSGGRG